MAIIFVTPRNRPRPAPARKKEDPRWRGVRFWLTKTGLADTDGRQSYHVVAQVGEAHYGLGWVSPVPDGWRGTTYAPEPPRGWWTSRIDVGVHRTYLAAVLAMLRHSPRTFANFGRAQPPAPPCQADTCPECGYVVRDGADHAEACDFTERGHDPQEGQP